MLLPALLTLPVLNLTFMCGARQPSAGQSIAWFSSCTLNMQSNFCVPQLLTSYPLMTLFATLHASHSILSEPSMLTMTYLL